MPIDQLPGIHGTQGPSALNQTNAASSAPATPASAEEMGMAAIDSRKALFAKRGKYQFARSHSLDHKTMDVTSTGIPLRRQDEVPSPTVRQVSTDSISTATSQADPTSQVAAYRAEQERSTQTISTLQKNIARNSLIEGLAKLPAPTAQVVMTMLSASMNGSGYGMAAMGAVNLASNAIDAATSAMHYKAVLQDQPGLKMEGSSIKNALYWLGKKSGISETRAIQVANHGEPIVQGALSAGTLASVYFDNASVFSYFNVGAKATATAALAVNHAIDHLNVKKTEMAEQLVAEQSHLNTAHELELEAARYENLMRTNQQLRSDNSALHEEITGLRLRKNRTST
ncbi:hypothetical protein [Candidatus Pantoea multigeneris]|uniref:Uncharacterized protein n=1 Tax=Candidatus Pantoea multigeneris TaxID=2608357 RepID=A0ABX0R8E0_9GAMM|nr:hypothetical protein [Pantoea multigeneris]NIF20728.1 hypothetical protein [Pantoea multigeneris]